jgi:hypothetical protein
MKIINAAATPTSPNVVLICLVVALLLLNVWAMWRWRIALKAWGRALDGWEEANALNLRALDEFERRERELAARKGSSRS